MDITSTLTQDDLSAILTVLEPVVLEGYGVYFKPKYNSITQETWDKGVAALHKELSIVPVNAQEGTVYVAAEKTPENDFKALKIATDLLVFQTSQLAAIHKETAQSQTQPSVQVETQESTNLAQDTPGFSDEEIYGSLENKSGWLNALHSSFEAFPLQSDSGERVMSLRPREQNIKSMTYMKAINDLSRLVPCKLAIVDSQRFMIAKTQESEAKFNKIAADLFDLQQANSNQVLASQPKITTPTNHTQGVILRKGKILNPGSVFGNTPAAPILRRGNNRNS